MEMPEPTRRNCWEYKGCGRQPGGDKVDELGVCPAATSNGRLDGMHGGAHGGRACWVIVGTLCQGKVQGTFAQKIDTCLHCDFYAAVKHEEAEQFVLAPSLFELLDKTG